MNYKRAQKEVLSALLNADPVTESVVPGGGVLLTIGGVMGYVFPDDVNRIDLEKVDTHLAWSALHFSDALYVENKVEFTDDLLDKRGTILRKLRRVVDGEAIYVQESMLKNFDNPTVYQLNRLSPVVLTEDDDLEGEHIVGFVMPYKVNE